MKRCFVLFTFLVLLRPILYGQELDPVSRWATIAGSEFRVHPNIVYNKANNVDLRLDVITLDNTKKPRPTLISIHGGGWVAGSKEPYGFRSLPFLAHGMNVVNVEYRLASVSLAPGAVEDCRCALRWVYDHAEEDGFDTSKLVVEGSSAGGHLSLMTGMLTPGAGFDNECPGHISQGKRENVKVAAIVNYFGITDVADLLQGPDTRWWALMWLGSQPNRMELARRLSPLTYVRKDLPPIITLQGDKDPTVPYSHGVRLHKALDAAGVPNELVTIPGGGHGGWPRAENLRAQTAVFSFLEAHGVLPR
jgi:acetyl esterase/lipase